MSEWGGGSGKKLDRQIAVQGFDARTVDIGWSVRLIQGRRSGKMFSYEQVFILVFRESDIPGFSSRWDGWLVLDVRKFDVSNSRNATAVYRRVVDNALSVSNSLRRGMGCPVPRPDLISQYPGPFSVRYQKFLAGLEHLEGVGCFSMRVVAKDEMGKILESVFVFTAEVGSGLDFGFLALSLGDTEEVLSAEGYEFWLNGVFEGREVWRATEKSSLEIYDYVHSLGLAIMGSDREW